MINALRASTCGCGTQNNSVDHSLYYVTRCDDALVVPAPCSERIVVDEKAPRAGHLVRLLFRLEDVLDASPCFARHVHVGVFVPRHEAGRAMHPQGGAAAEPVRNVVVVEEV